MCLSCWWLPGGWQRDMPRAPLGSWLPPAWGCFASQAWEVSSVLSSFHCYLYKSATKTHSREVLWKWWETLQQSPDFQASWRCAQRHTHTHTCYIIRQAVQPYFFITVSAPHPIPVFDALRKAITQFTFLKEYLQAQETLHQTGSVWWLITSSILL